MRLARRAGDDVLAGLLGLPAVRVTSHLAGRPASAGWAAFDDDPATAWTTAFGRGNGASMTAPVSPGASVQHLSGGFIDDEQHSVPTEITVSMGAELRRIAVEPGSSTFDASFPAMTGDRLTLTVTATEERYTLDRRFGESDQPARRHLDAVVRWGTGDRVAGTGDDRMPNRPAHDRR